MFHEIQLGPKNRKKNIYDSGLYESNFKISNEEMRQVVQLWKFVFKTKILIKVVLLCDDF